MRPNPDVTWETVEQVSIHASVKDATLVSASPSSVIEGFNPRIRKRCDGSGFYNPDYLSEVSIHASVKDATG